MEDDEKELKKLEKTLRQKMQKIFNKSELLFKQLQEIMQAEGDVFFEKSEDILYKHKIWEFEQLVDDTKRYLF